MTIIYFMLLQWKNTNSYLRLEKWYNFEISGMDGITRRRPSLTINGVSGGSRFGRGKWLDIQSRLYQIIQNSWTPDSWDLSKLHGQVSIEGDIIENELTSTLTLWKSGDGIDLSLSTIDSRYNWDWDTANFMLTTNEKSEIISDRCIVLVTVEQFQRFVNLALAMQDFVLWR